MASSSSAPAPKPSPYEVFLSFRGGDTRLTFVSHLRGALRRRGIRTFYDDTEIRVGDTLSTKLMKAIEESSIAIVVLSKNYASSTWCLKELVKIVECKNKEKLEIYPIFYHVEPTDVRHQTKSFSEAFEDHVEKLKDNMEMVDAWRNALKEVSNLKGVDAHEKYEASFIEEIVDEIFRKLPLKASLYTKSLVGMESRISDLKILINKNPDKVRFIGFCGMGGVGKTTTAKAVFEECKSEFAGSCFLQDVSQNKKKDELVKLQQQLLSKVLKRKIEDIDDVGEGSSMIETRLRFKRVLLVVDDVDDKEQLDVLAGDRSWFGEGSRIIITTRDEHLLNDVDDKHVINTLNEKDALHLFCRHAFKSEHPEENYKKLSHQVLRYACGLPLALKIVGVHLCKREESFWLDALKRLKEIPEPKIISVLQISFDQGLKRNEQDIFLYIACFFRGNRRVGVMERLHALCLHPEEGITVLIQKSLIHESCIDQLDGPFESFEMHDLLQDMGQDIVRQRANGELRRYSHIWRYEDIQTVLLDYMESAEAEGISMEPFGLSYQILKEESFINMHKLRFLEMFSLDMYGKDIFKSSVRFPNGLLYLFWLCYPGKSILTHPSIPMNLVHLEMPVSQIESTPDFDHMPNLEVLDLHSSKKLVHIHPSLGRHTKIRRINLEGCKNLEEFPIITGMNSLEYLNLGGGTMVRRFPEIWENVDSSKELSLSSPYIIGVPISIKYATGLRKLEFSFCVFPTVPELPSSLQILKIDECPEFKEYPKRFPSQLKTLQINWTRIKKTPDFNQLPNLLELDLSHCTHLSEVHASLGVHKRIVLIYLVDCKNLKDFPTIVDMESLKELDLSGTNLQCFPEITGNVYNLEDLNLGGTCIRTFPESICTATGLKRLNTYEVSIPISLESLEKLLTRPVEKKFRSPSRKERDDFLEGFLAGPSLFSPPAEYYQSQTAKLEEINQTDHKNKNVEPKVEKLPSKTVQGVVTLGPWGGTGGTLFDDGVHYGVRQINISRSVGIVYIRVCYELNGQPVWGSKNGGTRGFKSDKIVFDFPSEVLTHITGYHGQTMGMGPTIIKSLTFHTTKGKYGPYGEERGQLFTTNTKNGVIVGFHGKEGLFLDALGVHLLEGKAFPAISSPSTHVNQIPVAPAHLEDSNLHWSSRLGKKGLSEEAVQRVRVDPTPWGPGPWGGDGGKPWDDGVFTGIKRIVITGADLGVCCMEVEYDRNGQSVWSVKHGGSGGRTTHLVKLDYPNEVLTCVSGYYGPISKDHAAKVIKSLTFHTTRKKFGPFGEELGIYFTSNTTEGKVVGFHGKSGIYLDAVGVHMQHWLGHQRARPSSSLMKIFY